MDDCEFGEDLALKNQPNNIKMNQGKMKTLMKIKKWESR